MKCRPILFSGPMVQALLAGRKTQTRRVVKPQPVSHNKAEPGDSVFFGGVLQRVRESRGRNKAAIGHLNAHMWNPYGVPGDRLWVRETWCNSGTGWGGPTGYAADGACGYWDSTGMFCPHGRIVDAPGYKQCFPADGARSFGLKAYGGRWRPSIHMPRWASRITLEVVSVRVERVQDISEADAIAEGCTHRHCGGMHCGAGDSFFQVYESINGKGSWAANPWVWVVTFRRVEGGAS